MPFLCSAYKHSSPRQEPITCQGSCNRPESHDDISGTSTSEPEKSYNVNSSQTLQQPVNSTHYNDARYIDDCKKNTERFSLDLDVCTKTTDADQGPSSSAVVKRVFCSSKTGSIETRENERSCDLSCANYVQALLCYVALNVIAAVFLGNKPIMPAFFASQFCGAMAIIYWRITGTLPI